MPETHIIPDFVNGCGSCEDYGAKYFERVLSAFASGTIIVGGKNIEWVMVKSKQKAAGKHFIFTTVSHHIGANAVEERAALNAEATRAAARLFGENYRLINNSGNASSMEHYHCHIIVPGKGERLPRAVANVQKVIEELDATSEIKAALRKALLQQK
ncbi:MAG: hypothetical protein Q7R84_00120 [bacterium]|nr:hypothetical protein [bacterium]